MPKPPNLYCSDDLLQTLIEASNCSLILLAMRSKKKPIDVFDVANLLGLEILTADDLINTLLRFGLIIPTGKGDRYIITQAGLDMHSPIPSSSPFSFDPELPDKRDRLPSYAAFDRLPLRTYYYLHKKQSNNPL